MRLCGGWAGKLGRLYEQIHLLNFLKAVFGGIQLHVSPQPGSNYVSICLRKVICEGGYF